MKLFWFHPRSVALAVWKRRKAFLYGISAISLAGNAVALAESLEVRGTIVDIVLHRLMPQLRDLGYLLSQRPILYMLLNLIVLRIVIKSGVLGKQRESKLARDPLRIGRHHGHPDRYANHQSVPIVQYFNGDHEQAVTPSQVQYTEKETPGFTQMSIVTNDLSIQPATLGHLKETIDGPTKEQVMMKVNLGVFADRHSGPKDMAPNHRPKLKRASLFTIEPLVDHIGSGTPDSPQEPATIDDHGSPTPSSPKTTQHKDVLEPQGSFKERGARAEDYHLDRQEFNERVEGFITKFKRNLTMQRQDSFNRLLALVGAGGSMRKS